MTDFDSLAKSWDADPAKSARAAAVAAAIVERVALPLHAKAMEYGCGTGLLSFALHPHLGSITLADSSEGMLAVLKEKIAAAGITNIQPLLLDLATDPLPAERFSIIYTLMTMHHIPDIEGMLKKFHALLETGGHLCIADLEEEDGAYHSSDFQGHRGFVANALQLLLERAGFKNISFIQQLYLVQKNGRDYPIFLAVAGKV
jgi:ubiquinone/menaquinone biosynthesis C-methylase UbiE